MADVGHNKNALADTQVRLRECVRIVLSHPPSRGAAVRSDVREALVRVAHEVSSPAASAVNAIHRGPIIINMVVAGVIINVIIVIIVGAVEWR
jgi:hypothetical protein